MKKFFFLFLFILISTIAILFLLNYLGIFPPRGTIGSSLLPVTLTNPVSKTSPRTFSDEVPQLHVEEVVTNLSVPWSIVFTSPTRMLITERDGRVRVVENGQLRNEPLATFSEVSTQSEEGLMGMTLDPQYQANKNVYLAYAYPKEKNLVVKVVRMTDQGDKFTDAQTIIDNIPAAQFHAGCRLRFGPDGKLYITTGDATDRNIAQDLKSLGGKILRINADGSIPADNPFPNSPVFSLGHRNPQGLDWHPITQELYSTEHGPSGFDGPGGGDEVNHIQAGKNYGWPIVSHERNREGLIAPLITYTPAVAPASGMFYRSDVLPQFKNTFLFGGLRGEGIYQVIIVENQPDKIDKHLKLSEVNVGRVREVVEGPDGYIYFSSSNKDGRGKVQHGDDKIYRIVPKK